MTGALADRLTGTGYQDLLGRAPDRRLVDALVGTPGIGPALFDVASDPTAPCEARFLASELLFRNVDMVLHAELDRRALASCYFEALVRAYAGDAADWAFEDGPNTLGILGRTSVSDGYAAAFEAGLDDEQPLTFSFRTGIPPHFAPPYRVKDVAALIVAESRRLPLDLAGTAEDRDRAVAELRRTLGTGR